MCFIILCLVIACFTVYLRVGDYVTFRNTKFEGYLAADGILQPDVVLMDKEREFDDSLFCIHLQRQYAACSEYNEFIETYNVNDAGKDDKHTQKYLNALKVIVARLLSSIR